MADAFIKTILSVLLTVSVTLLVCGCGSQVSGEPDPMPASLQFDEGELNALKTIPHEAVIEHTGHTGNPFFVKTRSQNITQFPCSECHQNPLEMLPVPEAEMRKMHVDIILEHADADVMQCSTCHDASSMDSLKSLEVKKIGINHSYRLCYQCHFEQVRDWAGGSHGKRLEGWKGKRVVMNCTECHNPHKPAIPRRMPVTYPSLPEGSH